ncbi:ribokinase [Paenibacillus sp. 1P07SE]|uniref:ribokinase n=1 Tax=Paenibacillus sp. 1P07SE TaxID=3132209 RepID=UPI0039A475F1
MANILVVGSMNMDIVTRVERHPVPGETIQGLGTAFYPGGKGANQGVAAARSGASVSMAGGLGSDAFGQDLHDRLAEEGIDLSRVLRMKETTGIALITIDHTGENNIILSAGANGEFGEAEAGLLDVKGFDAILLQNEIPMSAGRKVLQLANQANVPVFVNPAPITDFDPELLRLVDCLILNEVEAEALTGLPVGDDDQARRAGKQLLKAGIVRIILTLGGKGSLYMDSAGADIRLPAYSVKAVDTTAAGDTFIGAFTARYMAGESVLASLRYATAAAALAVTAAGAQSSIPDETAVTSFLASSQS